MGRGQAGRQSFDVQTSDETQSLHRAASEKGFADRNSESNPEGRRFETLGSRRTNMEIAVLIHKDAGSVYGVTVPALPGCFSWGDTMDDALNNTREAVHAHVAAMISEGMPVTWMQATVKDSAADAAEEGGVWAKVDIDMSAFETSPANLK